MTKAYEKNFVIELRGRYREIQTKLSPSLETARAAPGARHRRPQPPEPQETGKSLVGRLRLCASVGLASVPSPRGGGAPGEHLLGRLTVIKQPLTLI